jgi:tRNA(adenine34) deaminase
MINRNVLVFSIKSFSVMTIKKISRLYLTTLKAIDIIQNNNDINFNINETNNNEFYMKLALRHAQHSFREKEVPIGAVIADSNGIVIATGRNQVETLKDGTAHAEILCLRKAANVIDNWRLNDCTLYTTLEPCPMCMGAIQNFRIKKVVYAASDYRLGACGSWIDLVSSKHPFHNVELERGVLEEESSILLKRFFQMRRRENDEGPIIDRGGTL